MTEQDRHSHRILNQGHPAMRARTRGSLVFKQGNVFMVSARDGNVFPDTEQGLYFHDTRYLSEHTIQINGQRMVPLLAQALDLGGCVIQLTNPDLCSEDGSVLVKKESLGIRCDRWIGNEFTETIIIDNYLSEPVELSLTLSYQADFVDMMQVRGAVPVKTGELHKPQWREDALTLLYDGADGHQRRSSVHFTPTPDKHRGQVATFDVALPPKGKWQLKAVLEVLDVNDIGLEITPTTQEGARRESIGHAKRGALGAGTRIETDNRVFNTVLTRSLLDIHMLSMSHYGHRFLAAGIPWYVALFGRDSLVTALQVAAFEPDVIKHTLQVLATYQGTKVDDWRDEQPGKILHEFRVGEMANLNEIPQTPYYGSVDSTLKFLILLGVYCDWVGNLELFHDLRQNVEAALSWIERYGDNDGDGYIDYLCRSPKGLRNQGWKDSGNSIVMQDGSLAEPPIALPEVQGETYLAWRSMARLFNLAGEQEIAAKLDHAAINLYERFNRDFWQPTINYYALCRQADGTFSTSVASNPAHGLWTGIFNAPGADAVVERIMQPDMFSGWGVRTLSTGDCCYNPVDYQVGSIWPHDNAFIVNGLYRTGHVAPAHQIFSSLVEASRHFDEYRLPETFAGYDRDFAPRPVHYPVACSPQAWAAGSIPFMLQAALGLQPDGLNHRLKVMRPSLPDWLEWVTVQDLNIAGGTVDLRYERSGPDTLVTVTRMEGPVHVEVLY